MTNLTGPLPAVVLAPGSGYHMRLPILEGLARALVKQGVVVYRFNWAYFVKDGEKGVQSKDPASANSPSILKSSPGVRRT